MSPDSPESRINKLERELAAVQQRLNDLTKDVDALSSVHAAAVELRVRMEGMKDELVALRTTIEQDRRAAKERGKEVQEELAAIRKENSDARTANRTQLIAATVAILVAIISAVGTIVATGGGV